MRRWDPDMWSGLAMLVVSIALAGPVLAGAAPTTVPRGWWIALFAGLIVALLVAGAGDRPSRRSYAALAAAIVLSWAVVSTAADPGLLPVLLVVTAAVSVHVVPLRVGFVVVGLNTAVLAAVTVDRLGPGPGALIWTGFYLLIQLATLLSTVALLREQRMRRELAQSHVELQSAAVLLAESSRTAERLRISRELHDLIGHQLTVLALELETARHQEADRAREHVERANRVARELLADVRATVSELRTEPSDLTQMLRRVVRDLPGLDVSIDVDADVQVGEVQTATLVRAVQEIVTNTIRHAGARELWIEVSADGSGMVLNAVDDGRGAVEPVLGNGLRGLRERFEALGGAVTFDGSAGFRVSARVPAP